MNQATASAPRLGAPAPASRRAALVAFVALSSVVSALFYYKWGSALRAYGGVQATGKLSVDPATLLQGGPVLATLAYFAKVWPALVYGLVLGALVRAVVPPSWVARALGGRGAWGALGGGLLGVPLMLCSCCVTPLFTGLYERGARLASALSVMLAAPGLNIAALALTFVLLPARVGVVRLVAALLIVFGLPQVVGQLEAGTAVKGACAIDEVEAATASELLVRFVKSLAYLVAVTVPLLLVGVVLGGLALGHITQLAAFGVVGGVAITALVSVFVALPTFFEIPIALLALGLGAPAGVAAAIVVAGPVVNLPSLLVLGRETRPRLALALAAGVWAVACVAGLAVSF